ncbi:alpha/beta fold hydrolase [Cryobacterium tepidiphilum]|uniref:Alpha/beta hydrolase n=1 Tax=Cryobacterium tepidiphilum TaxID=2486026 RepID=A0A3M8LQU0_9MICO|nr:alpha/beta hydrolase [Cryobacterium tepidiphilum]RNE67239.1 alpha/beta hydrolase [Cryobacterium tepidiphilum]
MTLTVTSADGSTIAYEKTGTGPAVIVIGGAFSTRQSAGGLAPLFAAHFSVYAYDRRGRVDSTQAGPYAVEREVEDLAALIEVAGGSACVFGHSSGGLLALEAAARGLPIARVAAYEPPYTETPGGYRSVQEWRADIEGALEAGDRAAAARSFMRGTGADAASIDAMANLPWWPGMLEVAHTLPHDLALLGDGTVPVERMRRIAVPTLLIYGGDSGDWAGKAVEALASAIPGAKQVAMQGQTHNADPATVAPEVMDFFREDDAR